MNRLWTNRLIVIFEPLKNICFASKFIIVYSGFVNKQQPRKNKWKKQSNDREDLFNNFEFLFHTLKVGDTQINFLETKMSEKSSEKVPAVTTEENKEVNQQLTNPSQEPQEPKNVQELTNYIQSMLQQMQDRFQTMSDQVS